MDASCSNDFSFLAQTIQFVPIDLRTSQTLQMLLMTAVHSNLASCAFEMLARKHACLPLTASEWYAPTDGYHSRLEPAHHHSDEEVSQHLDTCPCIRVVTWISSMHNRDAKENIVASQCLVCSCRRALIQITHYAPWRYPPKAFYSSRRVTRGLSRVYNQGRQ